MSEYQRNYANRNSPNRPVRKIYGVRVSGDFGKTWKVHALCNECYNEISEPNLKKKEIEAGPYCCDWCGARNEMYGVNKF